MVCVVRNPSCTFMNGVSHRFRGAAGDQRQVAGFLGVAAEQEFPSRNPPRS